MNGFLKLGSRQLLGKALFSVLVGVCVCAFIAPELSFALPTTMRVVASELSTGLAGSGLSIT